MLPPLLLNYNEHDQQNHHTYCCLGAPCTNWRNDKLHYKPLKATVDLA